VTEDEAQALTVKAISAVTNTDTLRAPLERSSRLRDLGVSSLMLYDLLSRLEEFGGFSFDDNDVDAAHFGTVDSLIQLLVRQPVSALRKDDTHTP
jgi:acyl carrier protein